MNCFTCERNLSAYIDDELQNDVRLEIEAHLDTCDRCRQDYESQLSAWEAAGNVRVESAPDKLWQALEAELQTKGPDTTLEDLALIVRGLASEVRDLRQAMEGLRQDMEFPLEETGDRSRTPGTRLSLFEESVRRRSGMS